VTRTIIGMGDTIPGRDEIRAGQAEGWAKFCEFCTELLTSILNRGYWFRREQTAKEMAIEATTKVFMTFKKSPERLYGFKSVEELTYYLRKTVRNTYVGNAIAQDLRDQKYPVSPEEAEEFGIDLNGKWRAFHFGPPDTERMLAACEMKAIVEKALEGLSEKRRTVLKAVSDGLSHDATAQLAGLKNGRSVGQELNRARQDLLKRMPEDSVLALEAFFGIRPGISRCKQPKTLCA
jgi:RNA polymerase sigma factor (sigma-70 family)